jgi:hypothetical protein
MHGVEATLAELPNLVSDEASRTMLDERWQAQLVSDPTGVMPQLADACRAAAARLRR